MWRSSDQGKRSKEVDFVGFIRSRCLYSKEKW
jgi:hypothetical protein